MGLELWDMEKAMGYGKIWDMEKVELSMKITKTKMIAPDDASLFIGNNEIQRAEEYVFPGHQIRFGKKSTSGN